MRRFNSALIVLVLATSQFALCTNTIASNLATKGYSFFTAQEMGIDDTDMRELNAFFSEINSQGIKCSQDMGVSQFFLVEGDDEINKWFSVPTIKPGSRPKALTKAVRNLRNIVSSSGKFIVEACLIDILKRNIAQCTEITFGWHRDHCAESCHRYILVFCLEVHNVSEHNFLIGRPTGLKTKDTLTDDEVTLLDQRQVKTNIGYVIDENFDGGALFHASSVIKVQPKARRQMLMLRLVTENTELEQYQSMKDFYKQRYTLSLSE